jgi:hypothetical protein
MNLTDEERQALAEYFVLRVKGILEEKEAAEHVLNILGKSILEAKAADKPTLTEIQSLKSETKTSAKGDYQLITKAENSGNPAFEKLRSYIKDHKGFAQIHGFKAWLFGNDPEKKIGLRKI